MVEESVPEIYIYRLNLSNDHMSKQNLVKSFPFRDKGKSDLCTISAKKRKN